MAERAYTEYTDLNNTTVRVSIMESVFGGSATQLTAQANPYTLRYTTPNESLTDVFFTSTLEYHIEIENSTDYGIITDIAAGVEGDFELQLQLGGDVKWRGPLLVDLSEVTGDAYPRDVTLKAVEGFTSLKGLQYTDPTTLSSGFRKTIQSIIEQQFDQLNSAYGVIYADTWEYNDGTTWQTNIIRNLYPDIRQLANIPNDISEDLQSVSRYQVLEWLCRRFGFRVLQWDEHFHVIQPDSYINGTAYFQDEASSSISDPYTAFTVDTADVEHPRTIREYEAALKTAQITQNHQTTKVQFSIADFTTSGGETSNSDTISELTTVGTEFVTFFCDVIPYTADTVTLSVRLAFDYGADIYYYNATTDAWATGAGVDNDFSGTAPFQVNLTSAIMPADTGDLTLTVKLNTSGSALATNITAYLEDTNAAPSQSRTLQGSQDITASADVDLGSLPIGDGPFSAARANLQDSSNNIVTDYRRAGDTSGFSADRISLKYALSHRGALREVVTFVIRDFFEPTSTLSYDSNTYLPLRIEYYGDGIIKVKAIRLAYTDNTVTYTVIDTEGTVSAAGGTGGSTGSTPSGVDSLDDLSDVTLSSPATDHILKHDGTDFKNQLFLTDAEITQLQAIDSVTISNTQWGYLGDLDQALTQASSPTFAGLTLDVSTVSSIAFDIVRSSASGRSQFSLSDEGGAEVWRIGMTGSGSNNFAIYDQTQNVLQAAQNGDLTLSPGGDVVLSPTGDVYTLQTMGVGTATPGSTGTLNGLEIAGANRQLRLTDTDDGNFFQWSASSQQLGLRYNEDVAGANLIVTFHDDGLLDVAGDIQQDNQKKFQNVGFTKGWTGDGGTGIFWGYDSTRAEYYMELDTLRLRGGLFAQQLVIDEIKSIGGDFIMSAANGKVDSVSGSAPTETVNISDPENNNATSFASNDIVLIKQFQPDKSTVIKQIYRTVSSVSGNSVTLASLSGAPADTGSIETGDEMVAIGNTSNTDRQGIIYFSTTETNAPYQQFRKITSYSDWNSTGERILFDGANQLLKVGDDGAQRIVIDGNNNDLEFYDASNNRVIHIDGNINADSDPGILLENGGTIFSGSKSANQDYIEMDENGVVVRSFTTSDLLDANLFDYDPAFDAVVINARYQTSDASSQGQDRVGLDAAASLLSGSNNNNAYAVRANASTSGSGEAWAVLAQGGVWIDSGELKIDEHTIEMDGGNTVIESLEFTLINGGKRAVSEVDVFGGLVFIFNDSSNIPAIYATADGFGATYEVSDPRNGFSDTEGNSGTTNIYYDTTNIRYEIENNEGSSQTYQIWILRTP